MAQIDTSIYQNLLKPPKSVAEYDAERESLKQGKLSTLMAERKIANEDRSMRLAEERSGRLSSLLQRGPGEDLERELFRGGFMGEAADAQKMRLEKAESGAKVGKDTADTEAKRFATAIDELKTINEAAASSVDQASYTRNRQMLQARGIDVSQLPEAFDPAFVEQGRRSSLTELQRVEAAAKERGYQLDVRGQNERERSNRVTEATSGGQLAVAQANLGLRKQEIGLKEREIGLGEGSGLPVLGVPQPTMLPWANQSNQKDANKVKAKEIERGGKEVEKDAEAAAKERLNAQAAQRFLELNQTVKTGGLTDRIGATRWVQSMGSDYSEMESITARLAPGMREPGSGSTSDYDGKQFERATIGVDKPKETNQNIARAIIARSQQSQDYAEFRQTYLEQNGTLQGADRYWKQYVDSNPIFDPKKPGTYELNPDRRSFKEHFAGQASGQAPAQEASSVDALLDKYK